ncbi:MAG: helix-turn-helix transcriptional regulator [Firmicutes bacterium]|nr:helix-turn-helix transcriptional regulator [Bacillota bacterium]
MAFSDKLRRLRKELGWTQDKLGEKIGVHGRLIGRYEIGEISPSIETLIKIAKTLNVSTDYLLLDEELEPTNKINDPELLRLFELVDKMDSEERKTIKSLIDAYVKKLQMEGFWNK